MSTAEIQKVNVQEVQREWLGRLTALVDAVEQWAQELGWSTRRIEKRMEDSEVGSYQAPALLMQEETTRALLEPIGRSAPGADGVVDLYLMPAYDDIASIYFANGAWHLLHTSVDSAHAPTSQVEAKPLSKETLHDVLRAMRKHAA